ncbi:hypothetical protein ES703_28680 [subsurface metagenome]
MGEEQLHSLDNLINYWENTLLHNKFLMSPSTLWLVENTVKHLKEFRQAIKEQQGEKP